MARNVARRKKKNYRLRKSVRRTLGALFMISAIIIAAIPFPDAAATDGSGTPTPTPSTTDPKKSYVYVEEPTADTDIGNGLVCETGTQTHHALYVRKNSDESYTLLNQFDFFEKNFDGETWGVISKYYDTYATSVVNLSSNVSKEYYTVTVDKFNAFFAEGGEGNKNITLDPDNADSVHFFQTFFLNKYNTYQAELAAYTTKYNEWLAGPQDPADKPSEPTLPVGNPSNLAVEQKKQYYCYANADLAGKGYTLEYVIDKTNPSSGSTNNYIYIAKGGTPPSNMKNDEEGFLIKTTASIIAIGSHKTTDGKVEGAFYDVQNVDNLTLPNEIKYIGDRAFEHCFIKSVTLTGVQSIGDHAFKNSGDLATVTMDSKSVSQIGQEAFYKCTALESIVFPNPLSVIKNGAFAECVNLSTVDLTNAKNGGGTIGNGAFYNTALGNLNLGSTGIATLGDGVFATSTPSKDQLVNVDLENSSITTIGQSTFSGRQNLLTVTMPAVYGVSEDVTLANNTFTGCNNLGMLTFPTVCGRISFNNDIFTPVLNPKFVVQGPAKDYYGDIAQERLDTRECKNGVLTENPDGTTEYGPVPYMFEENGEYFYEVKSGNYLLGLRVNNTDLTATVFSCDFLDKTATPTVGELQIPSNVGPYKVIGLEEDCFSNAVKEDLKSVVIKDNSLVNIGDSVFQGCTNITKVEIGNSVETIGANAFQGCTSLESVIIGEKVTNIKDNAFAGCNRLIEIKFESPIGGAASFPMENIGANALSTGSNELTVTGILEIGYGPFEWAMQTNNYVNPSLGIRVCYKTPSPHNMTVILDNQNNLPTLVDYPHYGDLADIMIEVETDDSTSNPSNPPSSGSDSTTPTDPPSGEGTETSSVSTFSTRGTTQISLLEQYEKGGELTPAQEALVKATLDIRIPAGIESIDVKGYLTDSSKTYAGVEPQTNGYNVSTYFTDLPYKQEYTNYGLFNGYTEDHDSTITPIKNIGNDRIRSVTMETVKYLPNSDTAVKETDKLSDEKLAGGAFYSCENLETVALGSAMEDVGSLPFLGCHNLTSVSSTSPNYTCENKILYETQPDGSLEIVEALGSRGNANDGTVSIDNDANLANVSTIADGAFSDLPTLRRVDFTGNSLLTELPDRCFYNDGKLSQVILPQNIRTIGQKSMANCADNVSLTIYGREVSLATDTFEDTEGAVVYAYKNTAAFNTADKIADLYNNVEVLPLDETYEVQFFDYDGITALTDVQYIEEGKDAEPPEEDPVRQGYIFTGWNKPYKDVMENMDIIALYDVDPNNPGGLGPGAGGSGGNGGTGGSGGSGSGDGSTDANGNKLYKLTVTNGEGSGSYPAGKTVTIKAGNAPKGATFAYWSCSNDDVIFEDATDWITTLTMVSSDVTVIANYTGQYTLEVEYGSGSGSYPAGAKVAISAVEAPQGRKFASWVTKTSGLNIENSRKESTVITMPASNAKITATYMDTGSISGNSTKPSQNGTSVIITKPGISDKDTASAYVSGSSDNFIVKISESLEAADEVQKALQKKYPDMSRIKYFAMDISLYDAKGVNKITDTTGLKINITMPIPDALREYAGNNRVGAVVNGELETLNPKFTTINGVPSISFTATHFSPYTIYVDTGNLTVSNTLDSTPKTGDGIHPKWFVSIALACISIILFTKKDRRYAFKAYR